MIRASHGLHTDALRPSSFRGTHVERAGVCSSVVRSSFGRVLCGVRLVLVRVAFARGGLSTGQRRTSDRRRTGGHSSDADILRHSEMGGGAMGGLATGLSWALPLRTLHGLHTGLPTDFRRTDNGRTTDGTWAGGGGRRTTDDGLDNTLLPSPLHRHRHAQSEKKLIKSRGANTFCFETRRVFDTLRTRKAFLPLPVA